MFTKKIKSLSWLKCPWLTQEEQEDVAGPIGLWTTLLSLQSGLW